MLAPRWRKILRDLWRNRARTFLVILAISAGVTALGVVSTTYAVVLRDLPAGYQATNPAAARLFTDPFDDELVRVVRGMPEVGDAVGRRVVVARVAVLPAHGQAVVWRDIDLYAVPDFADLRINRIRPAGGAWPPGPQELLIERAALAVLGASVGDTVLLRLPNDTERELRIAGLAHDLSQPPARFVNRVYGYLQLSALEWLGIPANYNELLITAAERGDDRSHVVDVTAAVRRRIERSGRTVYWSIVPEPGVHPFQRFVDPMALLLAALGLLALALSSLLVVNTISALLAQQVRQIGVMKAVGARTRQIAGLYLGMVLILGAAALALAVPLGFAGAQIVTRFVAQLINFDVAGLSVPPWVFGVQGFTALAIPALAALGPVRSGTRITVREAIASYGLAEGRFGASFVDRLLARIRGLPRPLLLSLRNTFRRKGRLTLTLIALGLGSTIFVAVFTVRASLLLTLDDALQYWQYDIGVIFSRPYRVEDIERQVLAVPGVVQAESWGYHSVRRLRDDGTESENLALVAPPANTQMLQPGLLRGRWLLPEDESALVVNTDLLRSEPDVRVGQQITLTMDGRETTWTVVGIIRGVLAGPTAYANYPYYARVARRVEQATSVQVVTASHLPAFQVQVARDLEQHLESSGLRVSSFQTIAQQRAVTINQFNVILLFLLVMAFLLGTVGALGLAGTMSINVLERTREIGVMRAVGATGRAIRQIVVTEGALIGLFSWLVGVLLALPISRLLSDAVGVAFLRIPLSYTFSAMGALLWLVAIVFLASMASMWPARHATRLSVRDALAYE